MGIKLILSTKNLLVGISAILSMMMCSVIINRLEDSHRVLSWESTAVIIIFVLLAIQILTLKIMLPPKRALIFTLVVLEFIFHFSHVFLQSIDYDFGSNTRNNVFFRFSDDVVMDSTLFGMFAVMYIFIGIVLFYMFYSPSKKKISVVSREQKHLYAWIFIALGLIGDLPLALMSLTSSMFGNYMDVQTTVSNTFYGIRLLSYLLLPGIILLIQDRNMIQYQKIILWTFIIYKLITMFSGLRAYALINILLIIYIYMRQNNYFKMKVKHLLIGLSIVKMGGGLLIGIRESRTSGVDFSTIFDYIFDFKSDILFNLMGEFGITQNVVALVTNNLHDIPALGTQFLYSLLIIVPGISYIAPELDYNLAFMENRYLMHNYGGSFIGDLLYDFGPDYYIFACVVLGWLFALFLEWYEDKIDFRDNMVIAIFSPIVVEMLFCIRSSLAKMPRMSMWYLLMVFFIVYITNKTSRYIKHN